MIRGRRKKKGVDQREVLRIQKKKMMSLMICQMRS